MGGLKSGVTLLVAVVLIIAGGALVAFLIQNVSTDSSTWDRYLYLLSGVEAVVFAAVGWLFGKEVHREQAEQATAERSEAEQGKQNAAAAAAAADAKGRELARAILATAGGSQDVQQMIGGRDGPLASLVRQARSAYPDA